MGNTFVDTEALNIDRFISSPGDFAYLSGSIIEGFGNPRSDIDVFVVLAEGEGIPVPVAEIHDDYYVDFEIYDSKSFGTTLESVSAARGADHHTVWTLPKKDLDLCYRTAIGEPIWNSAAFHEARQVISREIVAEVYENWARLRSAVSEQLARLYLEAGLPEMSLLHARQSAIHAIEAFLAAQGEAYVSPKWRFQKLARQFGEDSIEYKLAWNITFSNCLDATQYLAMVEGYGRRFNPLGVSPHVVTDILRPNLREAVATYTIGSQAYILTESRSIRPLTLMDAWVVNQLPLNHTIDQLAKDFCKEADLAEEVGRTLVLRLIAKLEQDGSLQW